MPPTLARLLKSGGEWLRISARMPNRRLAGFCGPFALASQLPGNHYRASRWFKLCAEATHIEPTRLCYTGGIGECPNELVFDHFRPVTGQFTSPAGGSLSGIDQQPLPGLLVTEQKAQRAAYLPS